MDDAAQRNDNDAGERLSDKQIGLTSEVETEIFGTIDGEEQSSQYNVISDMKDEVSEDGADIEENVLVEDEKQVINVEEDDMMFCEVEGDEVMESVSDQATLSEVGVLKEGNPTVIFEPIPNESLSHKDGTSHQDKYYERKHKTERMSSHIEDENSSELQDLNSQNDLKMEHGAHKDGEYSISDLVWGKIRSHPWWPGQIIDPSLSSARALRHKKKNSFLVAYFGDQSFAWNESSSLKPFQTHFLEMSAQTSSDTLHRAIDCALDEVARRVELGMACSCTPKILYDKVEYQIIKSAGVCEESKIREGVDKSLSAISFKPVDLVQYVKTLALDPCGKNDKVELVVAEAQLSAFYRLKGYPELPEFHFFRGLEESDSNILFNGEIIYTTPVFDFEEDMPFETGELKTRESYSRKRKHKLKDGLYPNKRKRIPMELVTGETASSNIPADDDHTIISKKQNTEMEASAPQSFKIGACISRIASQLTGTPRLLKCSNGNFQNSAFDVDEIDEGLNGDDGLPYTLENPPRRKVIAPSKYFSKGLYSEVRLTPRDSIKRVRFDEQSSPRFQPQLGALVDKGSGPLDTNNRSVRAQDDEDYTPPVKQKRKYRKRKGKFEAQQEKPASTSKDMSHLDEFTPTAIILTFVEADSVPSITNLNRIFKYFGPLKELETMVSTESNKAAVVFKKRTDGETAFSSAQKFSIFGPVAVTYELKYLSLELATPLLFSIADYTPDVGHIEDSTMCTADETQIEGNTMYTEDQTQIEDSAMYTADEMHVVGSNVYTADESYVEGNTMYNEDEVYAEGNTMYNGDEAYVECSTIYNADETDMGSTM